MFNTNSVGGEALTVVQRSNKKDKTRLLSENMAGVSRLGLSNLNRFGVSMLVAIVAHHGHDCDLANE